MMESPSPRGGIEDSDSSFRELTGMAAYLSLGSGSGDGSTNPLFESDPEDDDDDRVDGRTFPAGIGQSRTDAPETHLRRVRAGGLLTKLPFDPESGSAPRVRFFRVAEADRELQWGDPSDAGAPSLGSRLVLHEVTAVVRGHATRVWERHANTDAKKVAPESECFSLVGRDRTHDLRGGDAKDAALWAGTLEALCARARRAFELEQREQATRLERARADFFIGQQANVNTSPLPFVRERVQTSHGESASTSTSTANTPSPTTARAPASLGFGKPPTPPSVLRPEFVSNGREYSGKGTEFSGKGTYATGGHKSYAHLDYATGGGSEVNKTINADAAVGFVPEQSRAPVVNEGHVSLSLGSVSDEGHESNAQQSREQRRRDRRAPLGGTGFDSLGPVSRFANRYGGPPLLVATDEIDGVHVASSSNGSRAARVESTNGSSYGQTQQPTPLPQLTARTYAGSCGEDLVEAISRSRHGRAKELDVLFSAGVDPSARDANGLTLLHIACQNNQRKTAKLVLKRTDFSTNPPRLQLINKQTNLGQTALHYAFAYGYQTLGEYLLSLGADDRIVNVHGMTCYDGLDPDEPARETLNTPEMLELARRKKMERRAETLRPGTHVGNGFDQDGYDREDTGAPSSARGPWSDSAYSGYSGKSSARSASSVASGDSPTSRDDFTGMHGVRYDNARGVGTWDPRPPPVAHHGVPQAPAPSPPVAQLASPMGQQFQPGYHRQPGFHPIGSPLFGYHGMYNGTHSQSPYPMSAYASPGGAAYAPGTCTYLPGFDPGMGVSFAHANAVAAQQHAAAMAGMAGFGGVAPRPHGVDTKKNLQPPSPIMRGVQVKTAFSSVSNDDSSNLDTSSEDDGRGRVVKSWRGKHVTSPVSGGAKSREGQSEPSKKSTTRRRAGVDRAANALPQRRGGLGSVDADLDGRLAMRTAAMRASGFHSSDSDDLTSASEAERGSLPARTSSEQWRQNRWQPQAPVLAGNANVPEITQDRFRETNALRPSSQPLPPRETLQDEAKENQTSELAGGYASGAARREERRRLRMETRAVFPERTVSTETRAVLPERTAPVLPERTAPVPPPRTASVLPPRTVSKVLMVLQTCGVEEGDFASIRNALLTGEIEVNEKNEKNVPASTWQSLAQIFPSQLDCVAIRDAYVLVDERDNTNAANNSQKQLALQRANLCDRFLLEVVDVKRSAEKASALFLKTSFGEKVAAINSSLDKATAAATQAFGSPKLAKLVEIAMALGDILRKGETEKNHGVTTRHDSLPDNEKDNEKGVSKKYEHFAPGGWKAGALRSLAEPDEVETRGSTGSSTNLLRHLAKTVSQKSPDLLELRLELSAFSGFSSGANEAFESASPFSEAVKRATRQLAVLTDQAKQCAREQTACGTEGRTRISEQRFAESLGTFLTRANAEFENVNAKMETFHAAAVTLNEKYGPAPTVFCNASFNANCETLDAMELFVNAFAVAARETWAAKMARARGKSEATGEGERN